MFANLTKVFSHKKRLEKAGNDLRQVVNEALKANERSIKSNDKLLFSVAHSGNIRLGQILKGSNND